MRKRIVAAILAVCMAFTLLPVNAWAAATKWYVKYHSNYSDYGILVNPSEYADTDLDRKLYETTPYWFGKDENKHAVTSYNSQVDGTGIKYPLTCEIRDFCTMDKSNYNCIYAQWENFKGKYGILYIGDGTKGTTDGKDYYLTTTFSNKVTLADENKFQVDDGKQIIGWSPFGDTSTKYYPGQEIDISSSLRLIPIIGENWVTYHYTHRLSSNDIHGTEKEKTEWYSSYYVGGIPHDFPYNVSHGWQLFLGWNEKSDGSGAWYKEVADIPLTVHDVYGQYLRYPNGGSANAGNGDGWYVLYDPLAELGATKKVYALDANNCVGQLPTPSHPGYTFLGWYDRSGGSEIKSGERGIWNWTYTAMYAPVPNARIITCKPQGGDGRFYYDGTPYVGNKLVTDSDGKFDGALPVPLGASGLDFLGWFDAPSGGNRVTDSHGNLVDRPMMLRSDITIYGHWTKTLYNITFYIDPDAWPDNPDPGPDKAFTLKTKADGTIAVWPVDPIRDGYIFKGWFAYKTYEKKDQIQPTTVFTSNDVVFARWDKCAYDVTFHPNNGEQDFNGGRYSFGDQIHEPSTPIWAYHTFDGWYKEESCTTKWNFNENTVTGNIDLYAKWIDDPETFTVTFDLNGASGTAPVALTVDYGGTVTKPADPAWDGHTFGGWYKDPGCTTAWNFGTETVDKDVILYAKWTLNTYSVTFDANGGTVSPSSSTTGSGGTLSALPPPTRTGYTCDGWFTEKDGGSNVTTSTVFTKDTIIYAHWTKEIPAKPADTEFTVTFDSQGGSKVNDQTVTRGEKAAKPADPTKDDYTFKGWYKNTSDTTEWDFDTPVTENLTLHAKWEATSVDDPETFTVTFESQGGSAVASKKVASGGKVTKPTDPTKDGHIFDGWYKDEKCTTKWNFNEDTVTANVTLYAKWTESPAKPTDTKFTVTFDLNGASGTAPVAQTVASGGKVTKPADPTRNGYTFGGWYREKDCTTEWVFDKDAVTANVTLYAKWTAASSSSTTAYTVTFNANGGTVSPASATTGSGGTLSALPTPAWTGYTFNGWYTAASGGTRVTTSTVFSADATVYAHWSQTSATAYYQIYTPGSTYGGSFSVSHSYAAAGDIVTVTLSPWNNFGLNYLSATRLDTGGELYLSGRGSQYTFAMPASDVRLNIAYTAMYTSGTNYSYTEPARVKLGKWYFSNGCIYHVTDGLVPYNASFSRDMLVSILYNMDPDSFRDPTVWADTHGIVPDIYGNWLWGKDKAISREQTAAILFCYARHMGYNTSQRASLSDYTDSGQIRSAAWPAMSWSRAVGLMTGTSNTTLSPQSVVNCGQANVILSRFLSNVAGTW